MPDDLSVSALLTRSVTEVFNERDPARRADLAAATYANDLAFHDPEGSITGLEAFVAVVAKLQDGAPGLEFGLRRPAQEVAGLGVASWGLAAPGGPPVVTGTDVALVTDGRISTMWTLLDG